MQENTRPIIASPQLEPQLHRGTNLARWSASISSSDAAKAERNMIKLKNRSLLNLHSLPYFEQAKLLWKQEEVPSGRWLLETGTFLLKTCISSKKLLLESVVASLDSINDSRSDSVWRACQPRTPRDHISILGKLHPSGNPSERRPQRS